MKKSIEDAYQINIQSIIKISNRTYKIISKQGEYVLKYHDDNKQENMFSRLFMMNNNVFLLPIRSINGRFIETFESLYFSLSPFISDETQSNKDIRLHFYVKALADLHKNSSYAIKVSDGFFDESLNYLEEQIEKYKSHIVSRIERVERQDFFSPNDWYFLMNYNHFMNALNEAKRRVENLEDEWKNKESIDLCLTYQNFAYEHVIVKFQKIISLDYMSIAPSIYDLKQLFDEAFVSRIDIQKLFKEYHDLCHLEAYEIEWLLAFLFIPEIETSEDDKVDLAKQFNALSRLHAVESLANYLNKLLEQKPVEA